MYPVNTKNNSGNNSNKRNDKIASLPSKLRKSAIFFIKITVFSKIRDDLQIFK